jgi:hypothetical protein
MTKTADMISATRPAANSEIFISLAKERGKPPGGGAITVAGDNVPRQSSIVSRTGPRQRLCTPHEGRSCETIANGTIAGPAESPHFRRGEAGFVGALSVYPRTALSPAGNLVVDRMGPLGESSRRQAG